MKICCGDHQGLAILYACQIHPQPLVGPRQVDKATAFASNRKIDRYPSSRTQTPNTTYFVLYKY